MIAVVRHAADDGGDRGAGQVPKRHEGAGLDGPAVADDRHPVAQGLGLGEDVTGEQDGDTAVAMGSGDVGTTTPVGHAPYDLAITISTEGFDQPKSKPPRAAT